MNWVLRRRQQIGIIRVVVILTWSTVIIETRAELGMEADPMAASVAVKATTITLPTERVNPCACHYKKPVFMLGKTLI